MAVDAQGNEIGKLFVGGLHQNTNNDSLKAYFSKFGDIEESIVMMDNRTGRSRGFGYVKFQDNNAVDNVLKQKPHVIDLKEVDPKKCNVNMKGKNRRSLKIFVGGIAFEHDEDIIRNFFSKYGKVTDVNLLTSPNKQRHRGFAFVGFEEEEVVRTLIRMHYLNLNGKQVEVKPMEPPNTQRPGGPVSPGGSSQLHNNGRAVRGGRNQFGTIPLPESPYGGWNQWPGAAATGVWPTAGPHAPAPQAWNQSLGWGGAGGNVNQHGGRGDSGHGQPMQGYAAHGGGWADQSAGNASTNGWAPSGWGPTTGASSNRIPHLGDETSLYSAHQQSQSQRKQPQQRPSWDPLCYAALAAAGPPNANDPHMSTHPMDSWNPAALCRLPAAANPQMGGPPPMGPAPPTGAGNWSQAGGTTPWNNPANAVSGGVVTSAANTGANGGWPGSHSALPDNATIAAMAAVAAAAVGMAPNSSAAGGCPPWATSQNGNSGTVGAPGYSLSQMASTNNSVVGAGSDGVLGGGFINHAGSLTGGVGDWRAAAGGGLSGLTAAGYPTSSHPAQNAVYKR